MKVQYKNVCSMRQAEVEFSLGKLICIKGETNNGKSALFYTIVDGFTNSPMFKKWINNEALREDSKAFAWIGLFDDNGNQFQVEAGTNYLYYRTNDAKYEKVGRKNIFDLIEGQIPGLLYDPEDTRQIMNIQGEDNGLFPIDRTDSQIFKTYERLLSLSNTNDVLTTIKLDIEDIDIKITDALKVVQQHTESASKIDKLFEKINIESLQKDINNLEQLEQKYNTLSQTYKDIKSTSEYLKLVSCRPATPKLSFNVQKFSEQLSSLVTANNIIKYQTLSKKTFDTQEFDTQKAIELAQDLSIAIALKDSIIELNKEIDTDILRQKEISSILGSIKICPLCGKPMEECND